MEFVEWAKELRAVYESHGITGKNQPDFSYDTWSDFYEDGATPEEAFREDLSNADS